MRNDIVVLDACVLYSALLRDVLMSLAAAAEPLFKARWTEQIQLEWTTHLAADRKDITKSQIDRIVENMNKSVLDCLVAGYENEIAALTLPDVNDRHVLAAAIETNATYIITLNTIDFPPPRLVPYGVESIHPDQYIVRLIADSPIKVSDAFHAMRLRWNRPSRSVDEMLEMFAKRELPVSAELLNDYREFL